MKHMQTYLEFGRIYNFYAAGGQQSLRGGNCEVVQPHARVWVFPATMMWQL